MTLRHRLLSSLALLILVALVPGLLLALIGRHMVMPPLWVHFWGVGGSAAAATVAAVAITAAGARRGDARTVAVAGGFIVMASLLAVHGLTTPGVIVGNNTLISLSGAATLPAGGVMLLLAGARRFASPKAVPRLVALFTALPAAIVGLSVLAISVPSIVPTVPKPDSPPALTVLALSLVLFTVLSLRAATTYLLTRRGADLVVVIGLVLLASSLYGALVLGPMDLGWWMGHGFEFTGIALAGSSTIYDLRRGGQSRPLVGDLRAREVVAEEETFLGAHVRALMVSLAEKDTSTEEHTRRVAALAVELGEELGLSPARLRTIAIGGLLHDIGKLSVPTAILVKPGPLTDDEYGVIKRHPENGRALLAELGGFDANVQRLVMDHHERLDGHGYPRGLSGHALDLETCILTVCDVYDALVSPRVYRAAWPVQRALRLLDEESGSAFDPRCVNALMAVLQRHKAPLELAS